MKTNKTNLKSRIFAVMVSVMLLATCFMSTTAFAEGESEASKTTFEFTKVLNVEENVLVPPAEFTFTVETGKAIYDTEKNINVDAGVRGEISVNKATFTANGSSAQKVAIDFSKVNFVAPGNYHYVLKETKGSQPGIKYDETSYDLYVTVVYGSNDTLVITNYTMIDPSDKKESKKDGNINNTYETANLTLKKEVTGNQGDKKKEFNFTITFDGGTKDTVLNIIGSENDNRITIDESGKATANVHLSNGESVTVYGLTKGMTYDIQETEANQNGYATTVTEGEKSGTITDTDTDVSVTFTNAKEGTVPTGILLETAPYMILGAVVLAGIVVLFVTRRRRSH